MKETKPINKVGIITKSNIQEHKKVLKELMQFLKKHKKEIILDGNCTKIFPKQKRHSKEEILKKTDLVIVMGGDGTLLKTARKMPRKKTPILGVNFGTLGFLTECIPDKMHEALKKIFKGQYNLDRRSLLRVTIYWQGKKIKTFLALNDAVINQGAFARLIKIDLEINNRKVASIKADGLIIATPTGSTGHSLSAGGPIVHPKIESLTVNPICPSSLAMRPIVLPDNRQLTITISTQRREKGATIGLTLDGQDMMVLKYGDKIKIRRSKRSIYLLRTGNRYYRMLRGKLNWGIDH
jgi:NAD+ kinase